MIALAALAVLLFTLTVWWLTRPLRAVPVVAVANERADLEQQRDRLIAQLNELDAERADRGIDPELARDEDQRLSAELAQALKLLDAPDAQAAVAGPVAARRAGLPAMAMLAALLVAGAGLYLGFNAGNLRGFLQAASQGLEVRQVPPVVFEMVARLEQRLAEQPDDADGWARLGRSYLVLEQPGKARDAYARAHELAPDSAAVLSDYAWLVFSENPAVTTGLAGELYGRLARLDPENLDALWFQGLAAYQRGDVRAAMREWEKLESKLPPDSPELAELRRAMAAARESAGAKPGR